MLKGCTQCKKQELYEPEEIIKKGNPRKKIVLGEEEKAHFIGKLGLLGKVELLECLAVLIQQPLLEHQRDVLQEYADKKASPRLAISTQTSLSQDADMLLELKYPATPASITKGSVSTTRFVNTRPQPIIDDDGDKKKRFKLDAKEDKRTRESTKKNLSSLMKDLM
jgi:hypothetical protein